MKYSKVKYETDRNFIIFSHVMGKDMSLIVTRAAWKACRSFTTREPRSAKHRYSINIYNQEDIMSFKYNGTRRNPRKLLSAIICLLIAVCFFFTLHTSGFSLWRLFFGALSAYLAIAFFRTSKE